MRPESLKELFVVLGAGAIALVSSLVVEFQSVEHLWWFRVLKNSAIILTLFFAFRFYSRAKPFIRHVATNSWTQDAEVTSHRSVRVVVTAKEHKKGKFPRVDFLRPNGFHSSLRLDYEINDSGDITIYHPENSFMPPWREFTVKVSV